MKLNASQNKWFIPFLIAVVVAVAAIAVALVIGLTGPDTPDVQQPGYQEGPETGVYYYDVVDGEINLTLSGGNQFTIAGPTVNKTGTYTIEGANMVLDFFKDEDGTTTATISHDTITLVYDNATMTFRRKDQFTVTFQVNGGQDMAAVKVVNGRTLPQPADPVKENAVFLGWYADAECTTPFDFATTVVKADMTIYALWEEVSAGGTEYRVDFDLGYEGAEILTPATTVGGSLKEVPMPQRDGYSFGGWWISMYDNGQKLTCVYEEDTVFTADTTLYALWYAEGGSALKAPAVSVSGNTISWDSVNGAVSYKVTVLDPDGNAVVNNETVGATSKAFDFDTRKAGEYVISVVAVADDQANNSEAAVRYYANKMLDRVTGFTVVNGILIFGAVENAQKYLITIDCGNDNHVHTAFDNGTSTTYYIANCPMQLGGIRITVTASANGYADSTSRTFVYEKVLDQVQQLTYDQHDDRFTWAPVANAATYYVTVTAGGVEHTFNNGNVTSFSVAGFSGDITVSVIPATEGFNAPEAAVATCTKTAPAAPGGLTAAGLVISWNAVDGAVSYEVSIADRNISVEGTQLNLLESDVALSQGQLYEVKVKAINAANESSSYCDAVEMGYYAMNPVMTYNRNTVYWSAVLGASYYQVRVNGGPITNVSDATCAKVVLTQEGENLIEVRYVEGDNQSAWVGITVTAYAVEYDTRSVAYGSFFVEYLAVGDVMSLPTTGFSYDGYAFTGWYNAPKGAAGNGKCYEEGAVFTGNAYTVVYAEWAPQDYQVILDTTGYNITNITNGQTETVTYTKDFVLTVPKATNTGVYVFAGWYTGPNGTGVQITDGNGASVAPYTFTREMTLYPYYSTDALKFILQSDGTYGVYRGDSIKGVTELEIPATYKNIEVTKILESAFNHVDCHDLVSVRIPDTVTLVGASAFSSCTSLESIEVYKAKEGEYEVFYASENGVLLRYDMGTTYLELVPRAKTGDFTIPDSVDRILTRAFYHSQISSVTIPNNVIGIPKYAFYNCKEMTSITFATGRTNDIEIGDYAFYGCDKVETMILPASFNVELTAMTAILDMIESLKSITVENGGTMYASVGGMLTNKEKDTILYCPKAYAGPFTIPSGITTVGEKAFYERQKITAITVPVWVTSIGASAFEGCSKVESILFKGARIEDLTIGNYAFRYCTNVSNITFEGNESTELDEGIVRIGQGAFSNARPNKQNKTDIGRTRLTAVTIGEGVNIESIGSQAFYYQNKLREFEIDPKASVGVISSYAFYNCDRLVSFDVPGTVTEIGQYAFSGCTTLAAVNFRTEGATSLEIAGFAFNGCTKLGQILLPDHLTAFESAAFEGCDALKAILVNETNPNYLNDENGILYKKNDDNVLKELLFYPKGLARDLGGVVNNLPETLTTIGGSAFSANKYLVSITIPKSVTLIDVSAFANCDNLKTVNFAADGTTLRVGNKAFMNCVALEGFQLPDYTTRIGANAFENCQFTSFVVPQKVSVIDTGAFKNCVNLADLQFNTTVNLTISVGGAESTGSFYGCTALKTVALPKTLTELGRYAFYKCTALESVTFGTVTDNADGTVATDSVLTTISGYAFYECSALKRIVIPKSVTTIGAYVFGMRSESNPGSLEEVIFERYGTQQLSVANYAFAYQANLKKITFPARTQYLYDTSVKATSTSALNYINVFLGNTSLAEINIDNDRVSGVNQYFTSIDGVLYNGTQTAVLFCPAANVGRYVNGEPTYELIIPNTVCTVMTHAFENITQLKTLTFQEFDKNHANYGQQLLTIGNYVFTDANMVTVRNKYTGTGSRELATIGGINGCSITTVNLPSHLAKINSGAFASGGSTIMVVNINPDAKDIVLANFAFVHSRISEIVIPGILTDVGENLFRESIYLKQASFNLPTTVEKLPDNIFHGCIALESFEIPAHITELPQYAFYNCKSLKSLVLPDGLTKMGNSACYGCGMETLRIPASIDSYNNLGNSVFSNCPNLTTVIFEKDAAGKVPLTQFPNNMFANCTKLVNINLHDIVDLNYIGNNTFSGCTQLTGIDFTRFTKLNTIGNTAFSKTALTVVDLSKTQIKTMYTSFSNIATLETFVFPTTLNTAANSVPANVLKDCVNLKSITLSKNFTGAWLARLSCATGANLFQPKCEIILPAGSTNLVMDSYGVIYDASYQTLYLASKKDLTGYTMPDNVVTISDYAFAFASADQLVLPESVRTIGQFAFYGVNIPVISISSTVETIGNRAFAYSNTANVIFANEHSSKLKSLGQYAFEFSKLERIVLPDNLDFTATQYYIFKDCYDLKSVTFGAKVRLVPGRIFNNCYALEEILFQEGVETINDMIIFYNSIQPGMNNKVTQIHIPATVKTLVAGAFAGFENLQTVTIADNSQLESIGAGAFLNNYALKSINLPAGLKTIDQQAFRHCQSLEALDMSATAVETIPDYAFENTWSLAVLALPNNLLSIGTCAFQNTGVVDLTIPASVITIGANAFANAADMKTITFPADSMIEALGSDEEDSNIFRNTTSLETVILPNFVKTIGNRVFENSGVRNVYMTDTSVPSDLQLIGDFAFANCANLTAFDHLSNVYSIGQGAFLCCAEMTSAPVAEGLDYLGAMAFAFCSKLPGFHIPASVTDMGGNPCAGMAPDRITLAAENTFFTTQADANGVLTIYDAAKSIIYGVYGAAGDYQVDQDATALQAGALAGNAITSATFPLKMNIVTDYLFMNCDKLTQATLTEDMTAIGRYAFYNTAITAIQIPESITAIGDYAFTRCLALDGVTIPAGVKTFGDYCFAFCANLSDFAFEQSSSVKTMGTHFFYYCPKITQVILPEQFQTTLADAQANGQESRYLQGAIPSYTFAGTGIVTAEIPAGCTYYYTAGVFADCVNLERLVLQNNPSSTALAYLIHNSWFDGCNGLPRLELAVMSNLFAYPVEWAYRNGFSAMYVGAVALGNGKTGETGDEIFNLNARFNYVGEEFCLYFEGNTYQELVELFAVITNSWNMKIYDKDGNQLISSESNGSVACVKDANGNVIWEANT